MIYPQKPESLKRPSLGDHPASENPGYNIVQAVIPLSIIEAVEPGARIASVVYKGRGVRVTIWVEVEEIIYSEELLTYMAWVKTIRGNKPFNDEIGFPTDRGKFFTTELDNLCVIGEDEPVEIPEWASDEGCVEYRLRQQELREELDQDG